MSASSAKRAATAINRAISANTAAMDVAVMLGDADAERRCVITLRTLRDRLKQIDRVRDGGQQLAVRVAREGRSRALTRPRDDALADLAECSPPVIDAVQLRAALVLRDHIEALGGGAVQTQERVDGGTITNGQMEGLVDRRRPVRYALNAAMDAIEDDQVRSGAMIVILYGYSLSAACNISELAKGGAAVRRIKTAICDALDAASAHLGIAV